jgi:hypothetical protein
MDIDEQAHLEHCTCNLVVVAFGSHCICNSAALLVALQKLIASSSLPETFFHSFIKYIQSFLKQETRPNKEHDQT